jgi:hypothetical protein
MNLMEAWKHSARGTASYEYHGLTVTVQCTRGDQLTVHFGESEPKLFSPKDLGDFFRILSINPQKGWKPV